MKHLILDTDIGGDPDDIYALLFCLGSPEVSVDLIVTSDEHKGHRAAFARKLLGLLGKDIPVVAGTDLGNERCCMVDELVDTVLPTDYLEAIKRIVKKNPLTEYLCISPQSNLAEFLSYAPELAPKLRVTLMGGSINYRVKGRAEHNIKYDLGAARSVFHSPVNKRYVISDTTFSPELEVNRDHRLYQIIAQEPDEARLLIQKSIDNFLDRLHPLTMMHDPLTLSTVIAPGYVQFEQKNLIMNEIGGFEEAASGRTTTISTSARYKEFMDFLESRLPF